MEQVWWFKRVYFEVVAKVCSINPAFLEKHDEALKEIDGCSRYQGYDVKQLQVEGKIPGRVTSTRASTKANEKKMMTMRTLLLVSCAR